MDKQREINGKRQGQNTEEKVWRVKQTRLNFGDQGYAAHQIRIPIRKRGLAIKNKFSQGDEIAEIIVQMGRADYPT